MPFLSEKQRRYMWMHEPKVAERWAKETPKGEKLPTYVKHITHKGQKDDNSNQYA